MAYVLMAYVVMANIVMAYVVMAYVAMACKIIAYIVMADIVMAHAVMACVVMAYTIMAYVVMAYIVMAPYSWCTLRARKSNVQARYTHTLDPDPRPFKPHAAGGCLQADAAGHAFSHAFRRMPSGPMSSGARLFGACPLGPRL